MGQRFRGARRSTRRLRSTATTTSTSAPATRPHRSTAATTPTTSNGTEAWNQVVANPATDGAPDGGVQASLPIADGGSLVEGGSLGQMTYGLNTSNGSPAAGWPQFSADSVFSTAAAGDFYGTGSDDFAVGGASSAGFALGTHYTDGGHVRIYNDHGGLICSANTTEEVDSSPAVGPILAGGAYGIATGTGTYYPGAERREHRQGLRHEVQPGVERHARRLDRRQPRPGRRAGQRPARRRRGHRQRLGSTRSTPPTGPSSGRRSVGGAVLGSVTTADLNGSGAQDVIVPTDRRPLHPRRPHRPAGGPRRRRARGDGGIVPAGGTYGFQNAPLVTADRRRFHRHHGRRVLRHRGQRGAGHRAALRGDGVRLDQRRRLGRLAPVPPRCGADRIRRRWRRPRNLQPPCRRPRTAT